MALANKESGGLGLGGVNGWLIKAIRVATILCSGDENVLAISSVREFLNHTGIGASPGRDSKSHKTSLADSTILSGVVVDTINSPAAGMKRLFGQRF